MNLRTNRSFLGFALQLCTLLATPLAAGTSLIYVMNNGGTTIDVIDSSTNKIVQTIRGIDAPESTRFSPDGNKVFITSWADDILYVVDRKTGKHLKKIPLSGHGDDLQVTPDGKRVLVCIRDEKAGLEIIDAFTLEVVKKIPTKEPLHDIEVTHDGKYAVTGSPEGKVLTVFDLAAEKIAWELQFDAGIMPLILENNADGSGKRVFIQLKNYNGFVVVDMNQRKEVGRFKVPDLPSTAPAGAPVPFLGRCDSCTPVHGLAVSPDRKTLWVNSHLENAVFAYSLPDLKLLGHVAFPELKIPGKSPSGALPEWITVTGDSKTVYVSNATLKAVSAIDAKTLKEIARIPVGEVPKRLSTLTLK